MQKKRILAALAALIVISGHDLDAREPVRVHVAACLDSWDADAEPDGWSVRVRISGQPQHWNNSAVAKFTLTPVVPVDTMVAFRPTKTSPVSWTRRMSRAVGHDGWYEFQLPLRTSWGSIRDEGAISGRLRVRVSLPGRGVFETLVAVPIAPPLLVDTFRRDG